MASLSYTLPEGVQTGSVEAGEQRRPHQPNRAWESLPTRDVAVPVEPRRRRTSWEVKGEMPPGRELLRVMAGELLLLPGWLWWWR